MSKRKQQSLSRAFKRGNAIIEFSNVTKTNEVVYRKFMNHSGFGGWKKRVKNRAMTASMDEYCNSVAKPIVN